MASPGSMTRRLLASMTGMACVAAVIVTQSVAMPAAWAEHTVTVRVVIEHVEESGCTDNLSGADFMARVVIGGHATDFGPIGGEDEIVAHRTNGQPIARYDSMPAIADLTGDVEALANIAGQSAGVVRRMEPAAAIVREVAEDAARILTSLPG